MRRLWAGEMILGHDGPAGSWPVPQPRRHRGARHPARARRVRSQLARSSAVVPSTRSCCTRSSPTRPPRACVQTVKDAAEQAGRDPDAVKVWSCFATVGDHIAPDLAAEEDGRSPRHLPARATATCSCAPTTGIRRCSSASGPTTFVADFQGAIDRAATTEQLEHVATLIPDEWLAPMATGTPEQCVAAVRNQFDLGCDGVIMHGATPDGARSRWSRRTPRAAEHGAPRLREHHVARPVRQRRRTATSSGPRPTPRCTRYVNDLERSDRHVPLRAPAVRDHGGLGDVGHVGRADPSWTTTRSRGGPTRSCTRRACRRSPRRARA